MTDTAELIEPTAADLGVFEFGLSEPEQLRHDSRHEAEIPPHINKLSEQIQKLIDKRYAALLADETGVLPDPARALPPHFVVAEVEQL